MTPALQAELRDQLLEVIAGSGFLVAGFAACAIAAIRRRAGMRVFFWLGLWSAFYGVQHLLGSPAVDTALPHWLGVTTPYARAAITYSLVVFGCFAWLELTRGRLRRTLFVLIVVGIALAVLGMGWFVATGVDDKFLSLNNMVAACALSALVVVLSNRQLSRKYLVLQDRGFLAFGAFVFASEALFANLSRPFGIRTPIIFDHAGFAILLIAFGYSALRMVLANEHRLLSIESELEIARQIQSSILPCEIPEVRNLRISAAYQPMTAVAGDFYEFLPVDRDHAGFLVADVCGHGVPAALIASMLKVAVQSVASCAHDPSQFLGGLNRILSGPLRGQLVSAAYLWVDMKSRKALYSAAGHPPLLCWNHELETIESNGLLFGVLQGAEYPSREIPLNAGDRLLLYTDGIIEPENASGAAFGDGKLKEIISAYRSLAPSDLSERVFAEIQHWQVDSNLRQDDMTLLVIDVV